MLCCSASLLPMQLPAVSLHANSVLLCFPALQGRNPLKPFRMRSAQSSDRLQPQLLSCHSWRHHVSNYSFSLPCWKRCLSSVLDRDNWRVTNFSQTRHQVRSISSSTQTRTWRSLKSGWSQGHRSLPNQKKCVYAPSPPPSTRWTAWWRTRGPTHFKVPCPRHELYIAPTVEKTVDFTLPYPTCLLFPHFENTEAWVFSHLCFWTSITPVRRWQQPAPFTLMYIFLFSSDLSVFFTFVSSCRPVLCVNLLRNVRNKCLSPRFLPLVTSRWHCYIK